ncbi:NK-tumor recognition protein [Discoglossus pictus]
MGEKARPQCYFEVEVNRELVGRIVFQLFSDVCPETCMNFLCLCTGEKGIGKVTGKKLCYKGSTFHRVVKNFMIQGGDFSEGNGKGGESIYGGYFKDENFILKHDRAFLLSMANRGKHTNGSQFFITTKAAPHLDGIHVVFGLVISGFEVIEQIENLKTDAASRPYADVRVTDCGLLSAKPTKETTEKVKREASQSELSSSKSSSPSSSSASESSSSESEIEIDRSRRKKRKRKAKVKHSKKRRKEPSRREATREKRHSSQLGVQSVKSNFSEDKDLIAKREKPVVRPEEIPPVPENRFLLRRDVPPENPDAELKPANITESEKNDHQKASLSKSGRKIRGRGTIRYHTPPRSRSCTESEDDDESSETPPHWKEEMQRLRAYKPPSGEKWSKGDKLNDRLSSRWDNESLSSRSSSWSHDGYRSISRERGSQCKNHKKEKKLKHKKKSKKTKHSKKSKSMKKHQVSVSKEKTIHSKSRKQKSTGDQLSPSVSSRHSSKKDWSISDKEQHSSIHSSKGSRLNSRSRSKSRSRTASDSSSYSSSRSRNGSQTKSRSRNKSRSRSNSHAKSSFNSKSLNTVPQSPKNTVLPSVENKTVDSAESGKPVVHNIDKPVLAPVATDNVSAIPLSDSPPPSRWKPGQKPWKPSYKRIPEVKVKNAYNYTKQSRNAERDTKVSSYRKHPTSSDSERSDYSGKSSSYHRKSKNRSSRSRSYSRSYSRSRSPSSSISRARHNSHSRMHSSSYDRSSSSDSNEDGSGSRQPFLKRKKVESTKERRDSKSPVHEPFKQKESVSPKSSKSNSDSSSSTENEGAKKVLKTTLLFSEMKNPIDVKVDEEVAVQEANLDQQRLNSELDRDDHSRNKTAMKKEDLIPAQVVENSALEEKPVESPSMANVFNSEENKTTNNVDGSFVSSGKEEGEASSETDTEEVNQSKAVVSPSHSSEYNPEKLTKTPSSSSSSQENNKNKSKKRKRRSSKKSGKKNSSKKGKDKSKKKKEKKHKVQKRKQTFHWQPPLEFGEEEDDEVVTIKPGKQNVDEQQHQVQDKSSAESGQIHKSVTNDTQSLKENNKYVVEQDKSIRRVTGIRKTVELEALLIKHKMQDTAADGHVKNDTPNDPKQVKVEPFSPGRAQATTSCVNSDQVPPSTNIAPIIDQIIQIKEEKSVSNPPTTNNMSSLQKDNLVNSESSAVDNKWKPVQGASLLQMIKIPSIPVVTQSQQENILQGLRIEIKSKNKVRPGSLFDEVRKTARLNQRPRNQESSSEEGSSSQDEKSRSASKTRSQSKSRSVSRHRKSSHSYSRSRSRSRSYSYSSRSRSYTRSRSRKPSRYRSRSRSRSSGSYRSYRRSYSRSRSKSSYDHRRKTRSRSYSYDSDYSRSRSRSRSRRSRSYSRRSRSRRSYESYSGSDRSYSRHRRHRGRS